MSNPEKCGEGLKSYIIYTVSTETTNEDYRYSSFQVTRRYSDFLWLHDVLSDEFKHLVIPPIPEKSTSSQFDLEFIELRRRALQTFINKVAHRKTARAEDRPGVTRSKQWVPVDAALELLDTPGILWPKFDDPEVGKRLAFTGAVKDDVLDIEELACYLMDYLAAHYADTLTERYKMEVEPGDTGYELLEKAGRKRGFLMRGAQVDTERMARILLDEFRAGKLGRFTLETVED